MATRWSLLRSQQHWARFPPEERRARNAAAQVRYRERHRRRLLAARKLTTAATRGDVAAIADGLRALLTETSIKALRKNLARK
jgi:hypothetical protein